MSTPLPARKKRIKALLRAEQFDILHVQLPYSPFMAGRIIAAAPKSTAVIGTFHIIPFSWIERVATWLLRGVTLRTRRRFDHVFSVSRPAQAFARSGLGLRSTVMPNVVHTAHFHGGKLIRSYQDGKVNIVFLGRLVERKGCLYLLQALEVLHQKGQLQNVRVIICGKGPLEADLKSFVAEHHLSAIVHFVGFVDERKKADYLKSADIAVFPSTGGESFGIVLIEAMAAGSSVVLGGDNVGYRSVLGDRPKQLVDPLDTAAFARTLHQFIAHPRLRHAAAQWQQSHITNFDVHHVGSLIMAQYELAIAKRNKSINNKVQ